MQSPDLQRLSHIQEYCEEIFDTIKRYGSCFEVFDNDKDFQKSVSFSIMQIGELSVKLSDTFKTETSKDVPWNSIKGMRNLFAHTYGSMSREIIWKTATEDIKELLDFCNKTL